MLLPLIRYCSRQPVQGHRWTISVSHILGVLKISSSNRVHCICSLGFSLRTRMHLCDINFSGKMLYLWVLFYILPWKFLLQVYRHELSGFTNSFRSLERVIAFLFGSISGGGQLDTIVTFLPCIIANNMQFGQKILIYTPYHPIWLGYFLFRSTLFRFDGWEDLFFWKSDRHCNWRMCKVISNLTYSKLSRSIYEIFELAGMKHTLISISLNCFLDENNFISLPFKNMIKIMN